MKSINIKKVKIKNLIHIFDDPEHEDLLYEIVAFLDNEGRYKGEEAIFKTHEAFLKTKIRISSLLSEDLDILTDIGYLEKVKHGNYRVIKHLWE